MMRLMRDFSNFYNNRLMWTTVIVFTFFLNIFHVSFAFTLKERRSFQHSIIDYRSRLNSRYEKVRRKRTKYIIVHTSELGRKMTLRVVSKGKRLRDGRRTPGGHANYVIARNGRTYRILDKKYVADHAGLSMWNGETDISQISIGIELVGYHYTPITERQYRSVGMLIDILQRIYGLNDQAVLTHSQVAYGPPNRWFRKRQRGRKRCADNFIREKAGLGPTWQYDPDVRAGRLMADRQLSNIYYARRKYYEKMVDANVITRRNTAWSIAGEDFDSQTTVYKFPGGRIYTGDQISDRIGWDKIPAKTVVLLNQEDNISLIRRDDPIKTVSDKLTAWSFAGQSYNRKTTVYFLPSGRIKNGSMISDWDDLPVRTKLIVGYRGPYKLDKGRSAYQIAGFKYNDRKTIYYLPPKKLLAGDKINDFKGLPKGTLIFIPNSLYKKNNSLLAN
jgi:N-acetylmuramoyl-L-alanine amidase